MFDKSIVTSPAPVELKRVNFNGSIRCANGIAKVKEFAYLPGSPHGWLVTLHIDDWLRVWNMQTGILAQQMQVPKAKNITVLANGRLIVSTDTHLYAWGTRMPQLNFSLNMKTPVEILVPLNGGLLATSNQHELKFWNVERSRCVYTFNFQRMNMSVESLNVIPNGCNNNLITAGECGRRNWRILVWDICGMNIIKDFSIANVPAKKLLLFNNGRLVQLGKDNQIYLGNWQTGKTMPQLASTSIYGFEAIDIFAWPGEQLLIQCAPNIVRVVDMEKNLVRQFPIECRHKPVTDTCFHVLPTNQLAIWKTSDANQPGRLSIVPL